MAAAAGCGGSSAPRADTPASPTPVATATCPSVTPTPSPGAPSLTKALQSVPFDLPMPPGIAVMDVRTVTGGVHVLRFTTAMSLRSSVLFFVERYPKAGYVIGRGDAEATEADAPWARGQVHGLTRVSELQPCLTLWLIAAQTAPSGTGGTSPLLSPHPTSAVTSSLPFG